MFYAIDFSESAFSKESVYFINIINLIIYWTGVIATMNSLGINGMAFFKLLSIFITGIIYFYFLLISVNLDLKTLIIETLFPVLLPIIVLGPVFIYVSQQLVVRKGVGDLVIVIAIGLLFSIIFTIAYFILSKNFRQNLKNTMKVVFRWQ